MTKNYDFPVSFTCRHEECEEQFKSMAIDQVLKLSKFHSRIEDGTITFDKKNPLIRVELSLRIPGQVVTATHEDFNPVKALDEVVERAKVQLQKIRSKGNNHRLPQPPAVTEELPVEAQEEKEF